MKPPTPASNTGEGTISIVADFAGALCNGEVIAGGTGSGLDWLAKIMLRATNPASPAIGSSRTAGNKVEIFGIDPTICHFEWAVTLRGASPTSSFSGRIRPAQHRNGVLTPKAGAGQAESAVTPGFVFWTPGSPERNGFGL
jgi:hypothetical protein